MLALTATRTLIGGHLEDDVVVLVDGDALDVGAIVPAGAVHVDLAGCDLVPGLVDLHSDCLDDRIRPRPSADLGVLDGLVQLDTEVVAHGITTHFLCVSLETESGPKRSWGRTVEVLDALGSARGWLRADHRVHLRVDVASDVVHLAEAAHDHGAIDLLSYMDHTPGQGQYPDLDRWMAVYTDLMGPGSPAPEAILAEKLARAGEAEANRTRVAAIAAERGTRLAAHDDDSADRVAQAVGFGARISEFPVNAEALVAAADAGLGTVMGAPNARRGSSHAGNLSAREAIDLGALHALASDYHPPSMLAAAYGLAGEGVCDLAAALALVSTGPAQIAGLTDRGAIERGLRADLVAVRRSPAGHPVAVQTWVGGRPAFAGTPMATTSSGARA